MQKMFSRILSRNVILGHIVFFIVVMVRPELNLAQDSKPKFPEIRAELLKRMEKDQSARRKMTDLFGPNQPKGEEAEKKREAVLKETTAVDQENYEWFKPLVEKHGWLGKTAVGKDGAFAAWLLVQHFDRHPEFQKSCLALMEKMPLGEVSPSNLAYLTDRVLRADGKPIRYGTQVMQKDGKFTVGDVEDPENLDSRRASVGLGPMSEYLKMFDQRSSPSAESKKTLDPHVHILSPQLIKHWKSLGVPFSREDKFYSDGGAIMSRLETDQAIAVSMAHLYGTEGFRRIEQVKSNEAEFVRAENDHIAKCVQESNGNLIGFYSVNLLRPYADDELERCRKHPELTGLKLHLPACGINLLNDEHLKVIAKRFAWCEKNEIPVLIHLAGSDVEEFGIPAASRFWKSVVEPVPNIQLIVAHAGATGGYSANSAAIMTGFRQLLAGNQSFADAQIYFDLSGAILFEETDGFQPTSDAQCRQLGEMMREIGIKRFLPASDYPVFDQSKMFEALRTRIGLTETEQKELFSNRPTFID